MNYFLLISALLITWTQGYAEVNPKQVKSSEAVPAKDTVTNSDDLPASVNDLVLPESVRIPFTLERRLTLFPEALTSKGELIIDRSRQAVRWHFADEVTLILIENTLRRFGPDGTEEQVNLSRDASAQALRRQMIGFRDGDWSALQELVDIEESRQTSHSHAQQNADNSDNGAPFATTTLKLKPKDEQLQKFLNEITVVLRDKSRSPHLLVLTGINGDTTVYHFAQPIIGETLADELFTGP